MSDRVEDSPVNVAGVDEAPVEGNRRLFAGPIAMAVAGFAIVYAAFHLLALNGVSLSGFTAGILDIPALPQFPLETWNFRIVHVAGALALGFVLFAARDFAAAAAGETPVA